MICDVCQQRSSDAFCEHCKKLLCSECGVVCTVCGKTMCPECISIRGEEAVCDVCLHVGDRPQGKTKSAPSSKKTSAGKATGATPAGGKSVSGKQPTAEQAGQQVNELLDAELEEMPKTKEYPAGIISMALGVAASATAVVMIITRQEINLIPMILGPLGIIWAVVGLVRPALLETKRLAVLGLLLSAVPLLLYIKYPIINTERLLKAAEQQDLNNVQRRKGMLDYVNDPSRRQPEAQPPAEQKK